jgi:hypothetical protein
MDAIVRYNRLAGNLPGLSQPEYWSVIVRKRGISNLGGLNRGRAWSRNPVPAGLHSCRKRRIPWEWLKCPWPAQQTPIVGTPGSYFGILDSWPSLFRVPGLRRGDRSPCKYIQIWALAASKNMSKANTCTYRFYSAHPIHGISSGCYIRLN